MLLGVISVRKAPNVHIPYYISAVLDYTCTVGLSMYIYSYFPFSSLFPFPLPLLPVPSLLECDCNGYNPVCNHNNGTCACLDIGVTGNNCRVCDEGGSYFGDVDNFCYCEWAMSLESTSGWCHSVRKFAKVWLKHFVKYCNCPLSRCDCISLRITCNPLYIYLQLTA